MKKLTVFIIAVIAAVSFAVPSFAAGEPRAEVIDESQLFSEAEYDSLDEKAARISNEYSIDVAVITTDDLDEYGSSADFVDAWKSQNCGEDALILMIYNGRVPGDRNYTSLGYGKCYYAVGNYFFDCIPDKSNIEDKLSDEQFYDACDEYLSLADHFLKAAQKGKPFSESHSYLPMSYAVIMSVIAFLVILLGVFIYMMILRSKMKTARYATEAGNYVCPGSLFFRQNNDVFLYSNIVKTKIETQNSGSSGGGGSSGSSGGGGGGTRSF